MYVKSNKHRIIDTANLLKRETGLNHDIMVSTRHAKYPPIIKVYTGDGRKTISVTIDDHPKQMSDKTILSKDDFDLICKWILLNKEKLLDYWYSERASTIDFLNSLKMI